MAGDAPTKQDDIEELLRQAQVASGLVDAVADAAPPGPELPNFAPEMSPAQAPVATAPLNERQVANLRPPSADRSIGDDVQFLLAQAEQAIASVADPAESSLPGLAPFQLKDLTGAPASGEKATLELLKDVDLDLRIELGRTQMYLEDVLKLKRGSVVALDKLAGDPVDVFVNGRIVARGEVLVLNDNFCVRVTELLTGDDFGWNLS
jgi:flagellar motor switch protein FliN/FliY